ncbi:MAG TPA: CRTAC1 family protein, partial [Bryobacteraceae bacterium]
MKRRSFLGALLAAPLAGAATTPGFRFADITSKAGIHFNHHSGAFGKKFLPETLGPGCAFLDYDNDGWQDILLVNGCDWPGHAGRNPEKSSLTLYRNNRNGTFTDVTKQAGLDIKMYGLGVAVGDYDNDGFVDVYVTGVGQNRLFKNTRRGSFQDVTARSGLGDRMGFSTSCLWFDYDHDGWLDLFVCNYVRWSPETDIFCSADGQHKSYCTPEAYHGTTCWLFRNRGNGTFEDVTAKAGLFDSSSKSLGVALIDYDHDRWFDLFVANDTQPNKLYRNRGDGTFQEVALRAGVAFSTDGKARAGMGVDAADFDNSGRSSVVVTNFDREMLALYRSGKDGSFQDLAPKTNLGRDTLHSLGFGCFFFDANLDGNLDLLVVNGHIDDTMQKVTETPYAQQPHLFLNDGYGGLKDVADAVGGGFANPKIGRGAAYGDIDNDGDLDVLITTNQGPAYLYRNDQFAGNKSLRLRLIGTKSNRSAIGANVKVFYGDGRIASRNVKSGSSYLSQSELPVTFGAGKHTSVQRLVVEWPSGAVQEFKNVR